MTSSANDEWDYSALTEAINVLKNESNRMRVSFPRRMLHRDLDHAIDFIEYNMKELEITGGNGD